MNYMFVDVSSRRMIVCSRPPSQLLTSLNTNAVVNKLYMTSLDTNDVVNKLYMTSLGTNDIVTKLRTSHLVYTGVLSDTCVNRRCRNERGTARSSRTSGRR